MEFWEGALLVVGGIWLIGRISRNSPNHPVNSVASAIALSGTQQNLTNMTNTSGSVAVVAGEPLTGGNEPLQISNIRRPITAIQRAPVAAPVSTVVKANPIGSFPFRPVSAAKLTRVSPNPRVVSL